MSRQKKKYSKDFCFVLKTAAAQRPQLENQMMDKVPRKIIQEECVSRTKSRITAQTSDF